MFNLHTRVLYTILLIGTATQFIAAREKTIAENAKEGFYHAKDTVVHAASAVGEKIEAGATEVADFSKEASHKFYASMKNAYEQVGHYIKNVFRHPDDLTQTYIAKNGTKISVNQNNSNNCIITIDGLNFNNEQTKAIAHVEYDLKNRLPIAIIIELTNAHQRYAVIIEHQTDGSYADIFVKRLDIETEKNKKVVHIRVGETIAEYVASLLQGLQLEKSSVEVNKKDNRVVITTPFVKNTTKNLSVSVK